MKDDAVCRFRIAIRRYYEQRGMSGIQFAESIGYSDPVLSFYLTGAKLMSPWFVLRIKQAIPELAPLADAAMTDIANLRQAKRDLAATRARQQREKGGIAARQTAGKRDTG